MGGPSCLGVERPGSGALPPPTTRPFGRAAGAHYLLAVAAGGAGVGTRHQPHSARSCELALRALRAARGRLEGRLLPGCGASGDGRSPSPDLSSFQACGRGPLPTGRGCGVRACGPGCPWHLLPCRGSSCVVRASGVRGTRWSLWLGTRPRAVVSGRQRASLACLVVRRWCAAPRPVRSLLVLRSAFPSPWCLPPPRGLSPPAPLGGCTGHVEAGREPDSLCLLLAPAEARALGALRVVPVLGPRWGCCWRVPLALNLGCVRCGGLACVDPVTDASGFPYRPSFDGGLGPCTGAVSCGRRHLPFRVRGMPRSGPARVSVCAPLGWVGRARLPGPFWCASAFSVGVLSFSFVRPPPGWGQPRFGVFFFAFFRFLPSFLPRPPGAPAVSGFLFFPALGALGLGAICFCAVLPPPHPVFFPYFLVVFPLLQPPCGHLCCCFRCPGPWRFVVRPPPPFPPNPVFFLFFSFFLLFFSHSVLPFLCPPFVPALSRRFCCFQPRVTWALALSLPPLALVPFFFCFPVVVFPSRFSWFRALLVLLASGPPGWVPSSFSLCGCACGVCAVCRGCRPRRSLLVLPCCFVRAGPCRVVLPVVAGWSPLGLVCRLLFSAGVLWRGWSCLAAWLAALLCALGCCAVPLPCAVSCVLWLCVAVWRCAVVPCCPFCFVLWSVWRCVAPWRRPWCVVRVFGWCSVSQLCAPGCSLLRLVACLPCCFVQPRWCCVLLPVVAGCLLLSLVACCCFPLVCVVSTAPAWPCGLLPCCVLWFVVVPCSPALCPVFCGAVLPCGTVLSRAAVRLCVLVVLVCVLPRCVRCRVALRVVLFGAGLVCAVVGASCCGVSLCVVVPPSAFCGVVVLL